jgi:hypothetical protein
MGVNFPDLSKIAGNSCVRLTDVISAGAATRGLVPVENRGNGAVLKAGAKICQAGVVEYSVLAGPYGEEFCGTYQVSDVWLWDQEPGVYGLSVLDFWTSLVLHFD